MNDLSHEKRELAKEAKEIRESPAFKAAHERARNDVINELADETTTATERKLELVAELRAIDRYANALKSIADNLLMARRHA